MTEKPYTDADVELAARAEFDADQRRLVATSPNPAALEPTPWSLPILAHIRETYRNRARAGLDALAAAGRLAALAVAPRATRCPVAPQPWELRAAATGGGPCDRCGERFYTHVCLSCSPDSQTPGPGCVNCRQTGMDQTPCLPSSDPTT